MQRTVADILQQAAAQDALGLMHIDLQHLFFKDIPPVRKAFESCNDLDLALAPLARKGHLKKLWVMKSQQNGPIVPYKDIEVENPLENFVHVTPHADDLVTTKIENAVTDNPRVWPYLSNNLNALMVDGVWGQRCVLDSFVKLVRLTNSPLSGGRPIDLIIAYDGIDKVGNPQEYRTEVMKRSGLPFRKIKNLHMASNDEIVGALTPAMTA